MTKLTGQTPDLAQENIERLKTIFPDVFEEGKIDFEKLKQNLGEYVDDAKERYNFSWNGKGRALRLAQTPSTGTLRPCTEESREWDTTQNLYIEGDNLEVLKLLQKSYHGKVKMIYIDPPYNTGKEFVYPDNYSDSIEHYKEITGQIDREGRKVTTNTESNGRYHTDWLNMIYSRLRLARNLLNDEGGVIFISIDDNEMCNLSKICTEVFGEENFVGNLILQTATDNNPRQINTEHEYILCYAKRIETLSYWQSDSEKAKLIIDKYNTLKARYGEDYSTIQAELRTWIKANKESLDGVAHYDNVDEKGVFHDGDIANTIYGGYEYEIIHPVTGKPCKIPEKGYRFAEATMRNMIANGEIMFGEDETTLIKPKKRIENTKDVLRSIIYEDGRTSTKKFEQLMARDVFQNPKSDTIIQKLISFICNDNDMVMDFFSGSATTAQSVLQLNAKGGIHVKYVMVQLPENMDIMLETAEPRAKKTLKNAISFLDSINKSHTITEIGKERIRRAGDKISKELQEHYDAFKEGQQTLLDEPASEPMNPKSLDIGFKVFKLDSSNLKKWNGEAAYRKREDDQLEFSLEKFVEYIENSVDNYMPGRTELDVVYEIMLKLGLDFTCPVEQRQIAGKNVYSIGYGALMMCMDDNISIDVATAMAALYKELKPETWKVVFKDNGFKDDSAKTNVLEILKAAGLEEDAFTTV